jgi:hypothetical protein
MDRMYKTGDWAKVGDDGLFHYATSPDFHIRGWRSKLARASLGLP